MWMRFMLFVLLAGVELALFVLAAPLSSASPRVSIFAPFPGNRSRLRTCTTNRKMSSPSRRQHATRTASEATRTLGVVRRGLCVCCFSRIPYHPMHSKPSSVAGSARTIAFRVDVCWGGNVNRRRRRRKGGGICARKVCVVEVGVRTIQKNNNVDHAFGRHHLLNSGFLCGE